jgi:hypothetical protein
MSDKEKIREKARKAVADARAALVGAEYQEQFAEVKIKMEETPPTWRNTLDAHVGPESHKGLVGATGWQDILRKWATMISYPYYLVNGRIFSIMFDGMDTGLTEDDIE